MSVEDQALAAVRAYCGWHVGPSEVVTLTVDGSGSTFLPLPTMRLTDVLEVVENGDSVPLDSVEWSEAGYLRRRGRWTDRLRGVTVTIEHGYDTLPPEVQGVVDALARRGASPSAMVQIGPFRAATGPDGAPLGASLSELERATLNRYRLPSLP